MNGILLVDKPQDWTSHDVVAKLRGFFGEKRIGHAGTLDPMATGLLVAFIGRSTKAVSYAEAREKRYLAGLRLGITTDTQDITGKVLAESEPHVSMEDIEEALNSFRGEIDQVPPMYSAIKVNGKRLYQIARRGGEVERSPRRIQIHQLNLIGGSGAEWELDVICSKGTYVRTLCHDIGASLGCGGTMSSLRRISVGDFSVEQAHTMRELSALSRAEAEALLMPVDRLFDHFPQITLSEAQERLCRNGAAFSCDAGEGIFRFYGQDGTFLMFGELKNRTANAILRFF